MNGPSLLVGIGSPHGDDRLGWEIAAQVGRRAAGAFIVRCARTPVELLDWLEGIDSLDVCDAVCNGNAGSVDCWQWPAPQIARLPFRGSHNVGLPEVLALAEQLGALPPMVRIWGVGIKSPAAFGAVSPELTFAVRAVVDRICGALAHA